MAEKKRPPKIWIYAPRLAPGKKVPIQIKDEVTRRAQALVKEWKPLSIEKSPKGNRFNLAYMRHTNKWWETQRFLTAAECFETIRGNSLYHP
jgi:hypothetical protein